MEHLDSGNVVNFGGLADSSEYCLSYFFCVRWVFGLGPSKRGILSLNDVKLDNLYFTF